MNHVPVEFLIGFRLLLLACCSPVSYLVLLITTFNINRSLVHTANAQPISLQELYQVDKSLQSDLKTYLRGKYVHRYWTDLSQGIFQVPTHGPQQQSPWMSHQVSSQMVWNARWLPLNDIGHLRGDQIRFHSCTLEASMPYWALTKLPIVWGSDAKS